MIEAEFVTTDPFTPVIKWKISTWPLTVGRNSDCDVIIDDRWTCERHCQVFQSEERLFVRDLGSRHGTLVNGGRIDQAELAPGDLLCIGLRTFLVSYPTFISALAMKDDNFATKYTMLELESTLECPDH